MDSLHAATVSAKISAGLWDFSCNKGKIYSLRVLNIGYSYFYGQQLHSVQLKVGKIFLKKKQYLQDGNCNDHYCILRSLN
jgi:hypothetical protein